MEKRKLSLELIEALHTNDMMWMILGSLISADTLITKEDYENSIEILNDLVELIPNTNIPEESKEKYLEKAIQANELVKKEYEEFLTNI